MIQKGIEQYNTGDLFTSIPTSLVLVDNNKKVLKANPEARKLLGENIESMNLEEVFKSEKQGIFDRALQGAIIERQVIEVNNIPIGFSASPIHNRENKITGAMIIFRNLTEIKEMEEKLRRKNRLTDLGEMAAGMAHEIRNPLAAIKAGIECLTKDFTEESNASEYIRIILKEINRLDHILNDMTTYAALRPSYKTELNLNNIIRHSLIMFEEEMKEKNIQINDHYDGELTFIADEDQIVTVINNLLLNAIDAIEKDGTIEMSTIGTKDSIKFSIRNVGRKIPEDILPKIFIPFFTTKSKGSGLGLSIVNRMVQNHNGTIKAYNWEKGACFSVTLPKGL